MLTSPIQCLKVNLCPLSQLPYEHKEVGNIVIPKNEEVKV